MSNDTTSGGNEAVVELPSMIGDTLTASGNQLPQNTAGGSGIQHR